MTNLQTRLKANARRRDISSPPRMDTGKRVVFALIRHTPITFPKREAAFSCFGAIPGF
jgi:hypothetical protein